MLASARRLSRKCVHGRMLSSEAKVSLNAIQKRVVALQSLHQDYEEIELKAKIKTREIDQARLAEAASLFARRRELVCGADATEKEASFPDVAEDVVSSKEIPHDGKGIPGFWLEVLVSITEDSVEQHGQYGPAEDDSMALLHNRRDVDALERLADVRFKLAVDSEAKTEKLTFEFEFDESARGTIFAESQPLLLSTTYTRCIATGALKSATGCAPVKWASESVNPLVKVMAVASLPDDEDDDYDDRKGRPKPKPKPKKVKAVKVHSVFQFFDEVPDYEDLDMESYLDEEDEDGEFYDDVDGEATYDMFAAQQKTERFINVLESQLPNAGMRYFESTRHEDPDDENMRQNLGGEYDNYEEEQEFEKDKKRR